MAQVTIYLPDPIAKRLRAASRKAKKSLSAYVADLLQPGARPSGWPVGFFELAGSTSIEAPDDPPPAEPPAL